MVAEPVGVGALSRDRAELELDKMLSSWAHVVEWRLAGNEGYPCLRGSDEGGRQSGRNGLPTVAGPFLAIQRYYEAGGPVVQKILLKLWVQRVVSVEQVYRSEYAIRGRLSPMERGALKVWLRRYSDWRSGAMRGLGLLGGE